MWVVAWQGRAMVVSREVLPASCMRVEQGSELVFEGVLACYLASWVGRLVFRSRTSAFFSIVS
jgi:hypothetical protein